MALNRVDLMKWRMALRHPNGPATANIRHVLLTLSTWGSKDGGDMFPSIETLATATRLHRETVRRALKDATQAGWVMRQEMPRRGPLGGFRYVYQASVPDQWLEQNKLDDRWETNPEFVSERQKRHRVRQGRVPAQDRDTSVSAMASAMEKNGDRHAERLAVPADSRSVPVVSRKRPGPESAVSLSTVDGVPVQDSPTSSGISSGTSSCTSSQTSSVTGVGASRLDDLRREILGERDHVPLKSPRSKSKEPKNASFEAINNRVEKVFVEHSLKGISLGVEKTELIARLTGLTEEQVRISIGQLSDRGKLPIPPRRAAGARAVGKQR